jgi:hypothetical protein
MSEATLTFAGVILGAAIAGGVSLWQVQLVAKRDAKSNRHSASRSGRRWRLRSGVNGSGRRF